MNIPAVAGLLVLESAVAAAATRGGGPAEGRGRFIAALELPADAAADFVWPHESLPPLRHASVLLVVERIPRVSEDGAAGKPRELPPWRLLWINGRLLPRARIQAPARVEKGRAAGQGLLVRLEAGRIRLRLALPPGARLDTLQRTAAIRLYEAGPRGGDR
jgi:hypothetical protein